MSAAQIFRPAGLRERQIHHYFDFTPTPRLHNNFELHALVAHIEDIRLFDRRWPSRIEPDDLAAQT